MSQSVNTWQSSMEISLPSEKDLDHVERVNEDIITARSFPAQISGVKIMPHK